MAAGLGFKTFTTGEVLTAADVNGYLMQGVLVFASAAARDAAITSPQEGQACYLKDTNEVLTYSGSTWVAVGGGSPLTTKGDLYTFSTVDARIAVGANGTVLQADSAEATGLKWVTATAPNKSYSLINAGGTALTGATTITVSGISGKDNLLVIIDGCSSASVNSTFRIRFNADSGSNYQFAQGEKTAQSAYGVNIFETDSSAATTSIIIGKLASDAAGVVTGGFSVYGAASTGFKAVQFNTGAYTPSGSTGGQGVDGVGMYFATAAITSVSIISGTGNFDAGTIYVYGA